MTSGFGSQGHGLVQTRPVNNNHVCPSKLSKVKIRSCFKIYLPNPLPKNTLHGNPRAAVFRSVTRPPSVWKGAQTGITLGKEGACHLEEKMSAEAEMCEGTRLPDSKSAFQQGRV